MAESYILPQVKVFQEFLESPDDVTQSLHPFVFGPQYQLMRYSAADERADCATGSYTGDSDLVIPWSTGVYGSTVDTAYAKVTFTGIKVMIPGSGSNTGTFTAKGVADGTESSVGDATFYSRVEVKGTALSPSTTLARSVKVGDYVGYTVTEGSSSVVKYSRITGLNTGTLSSSDPTEITSAVTKSGTTSTDITVDTTGYHGGVSGRVSVSVKVKSGKRVVEWTSSSIGGVSGSSTVDTNAITDGATVQDAVVQLGKGLSITVKGGTAAVSAGQTTITGGASGQYTVSLTVSEAAVVDTVVLSDVIALPSNGAEIFFAADLPDQDIDKKLVNWAVCSKDASADASATNVDGVKVFSGIKITNGGVDYTVKSAKVYVTQRNLVKSHTTSISSLSSSSAVAAELGPITPDNPLAYGVYCAALNSAGTPVYYMGTDGTDLSAYLTVLDRATLVSDVYAFCPLSRDTAIIDAVIDHVNEMSSEENKQWRIAFVSLPYSGTVDVTPVHPGGEAAKSKIDLTNHTLTAVGDAQGSTVDSYASFSGDVAVGDEIRIATGDSDDYGVDTYYSLYVGAVLSNASLRIATDRGDWSEFATKYTTGTVTTYSILHSRNSDEAAQAIAEGSSGLYDRRAYNVFPTEAISAGVTVTGQFMAAAVAGLACSVQPQRPITNVELKGFDDLPLVYRSFSREQLNTIAAGGTLIVMQDKPGSTVYIRHQLSTARAGGNLNTTELSLVKNLDSISYYLSNLFTPYIGRYNVTDELIRILRNVLTSGLVHLETATETNTLVGPQVLSAGTKIVSLEQSSTSKDTVYANVNLALPTPFNNFDLHLLVI